MNRRYHHAFVAFAAILLLLLSQLAVAAHLCVHAAATLGHAVAVSMPADCPDEAPPANLCQQHCQFGHCAFDTDKPVGAFDVTAGPALAVDYRRDLPLHRHRLRELPPPPEPPPTIRFSVLRI